MSRVVEGLKHSAQRVTDHIANGLYRDGFFHPTVQGVDQRIGVDQHGRREIDEASGEVKAKSWSFESAPGYDWPAPEGPMLPINWHSLTPAEIAGELRRRHLITHVDGFDLPGIDVTTIRDFAQSLDKMLTKYPIELFRVNIGPIRDTSGHLTDEVAHTRSVREHGTDYTTITLNERHAAEPELITSALEADLRSGAKRLDPARLTESIVVHEFGHALHGSVPNRRSQDIENLLREYHGDLSGYSFYENGELNSIEAVAEAFTAVELDLSPRVGEQVAHNWLASNARLIGG